MHLTLLIPELVWSNPDDRTAFAPIELHPAGRRLAALTPARRPAAATESVLASLAGYDEAEPPLAALRLAGEKGEAGEMLPAGHILCADPVHLRFHQELLILADHSELQLDEDESAALIASLNTQLAPVRFVAASPDRWYVALADTTAADIGSPPVSAVAGRSLTVTQWSSSPALRRLANEAQMILHGHPVNTRRQAAGKPMANGLWLWGGGAMPPAVPPLPYSSLAGSGPLITGVARRAACPWQKSPLHLEALTGAGTRPLVLLDDLILPAQRQDAAAFTVAWRCIADNWLQPALAARRRGRLASLRILAPTAYGVLDWHLSALNAWRPLWRAPSFAALAANLASTAPQ